MVAKTTIPMTTIIFYDIIPTQLFLLMFCFRDPHQQKLHIVLLICITSVSHNLKGKFLLNYS